MVGFPNVRLSEWTPISMLEVGEGFLHPSWAHIVVWLSHCRDWTRLLMGSTVLSYLVPLLSTLAIGRTVKVIQLSDQLGVLPLLATNQALEIDNLLA